MGRFEGARTFLVTGTSSGLGVAISSAIRDRGGIVCSISRTRPDTDDEVWVHADLGDTDSIRTAVDLLCERIGVDRLDGVVLNAALADKSRPQWSAEQVERHFRVNALGSVALWNDLHEADVLASPCNVVILGSFLQNGNARQPAYSMSKAALWAWMRSYTMSQPSRAPISMNMVWPGRVDTPANPVRDLPVGDPNHFYRPERVAEVVVRFLQERPGGPRGTVTDMGRS